MELSDRVACCAMVRCRRVGWRRNHSRCHGEAYGRSGLIPILQSGHTPPGEWCSSWIDYERRSIPGTKFRSAFGGEIVGDCRIVGAADGAAANHLWRDAGCRWHDETRGRELNPKTSMEAIDSGVAKVDRKRVFFVPEMSVRENTSLARLRQDQKVRSIFVVKLSWRKRRSKK